MNRYVPLILIICLVTFMDYLDSTIIFIAGPEVSLFFNLGVSDGSWLVMVYDLILCAMLIPLSKLAKHGHSRNMLIIGLSIFIIGTVMCFFSDFNYWVLITFRVVEGIGAALCAATLPILIVTMFPEDMQGRDRSHAHRCRTDGVKTVYCGSLCEIRKCAMSRGYETCGDCSEIDCCKKASVVIGNNPEARNNLTKS